MVVPNAFIVGVNKAGTTAVFNSLSRQPGVCASTTKETHFFDPLKYGKPLPQISAYERFFAPRAGDHAVLEATPGYFYGGERLASAIREVAPASRAAIILREPGARAFSWWRFCRTRLLLPQDLSFESYLDKCESLGIAPEAEEKGVAWRGLSGGQYSEWLPAWQRTFGEDLLVMYSDDFAAAPQAALERIGGHFGISVEDTTSRQENVSVDIKNTTLQKLALKANRAGERVWRKNPEIKHALLSAYYLLNSRGRQEKMSPASRERLNEHFAPRIHALRSLLPDVPAGWSMN